MSGSGRGVAAMFIAVAAFSFMDALLKLFASHYPPMQVTAIRGAASLPFVLLPLWYSGRLAELRPQRIGLHIVRGLIGIVMLATFVLALRDGSLAAVYSIYMAAPLLIAAMAAIWLGERVDSGRWLAIVVGLAGVLIILQPRADGLPLLAGIAATVSALAYALAAITARLLTRTERSPSIVFVFLVILTVVAGALAIPDWVPIRDTDWGLIAAAGALGAAGQHYITEAFRHAPAAVVAPVEYTALLWGLSIDWVAWAVLPNGTMLGGAALVIAAGIYVAWRERRAA
ncbi:MAG: DMT family transporter [Gammaproteobacteria bacterium]|nr:DMT family transporter [Gammaproteobacteria bacterium]